MEPTPNGGSATPSRDAAERDPAERDPAEREVAGPDTDPMGLDAAVPRPGLPILPRRARGSDEPRPARGAEPRRPPGRDPDGRPYGASDEETLHRLLSGLRDI